MPRHILDTARHDSVGRRLRRFLSLERRERLNGPHPAIVALHRQPLPVRSDLRLKRFVKIERGVQ
ncbi:hypothetical protein DXV76_17965 [Rhodobacteraceae bacterium CCMM004]|nr:hypothetical protein DXV76_17965 [Rhodobacteraceae bacterium CCMM004]